MRRAPTAVAAAATGLLALPAAAGAATAAVDSDTLAYRAAPGEANRLVVTARGGGIELRDPGAAITPGVSCQRLDDHAVSCAGAKSVVARLGDLADEARVGDQLSTELYGSSGDDVLKGGPGPDYVEGGAGRDALDGEDGDDSFRAEASTSAPDRIDGGLGRDVVRYDLRRRAISVNIGQGRGDAGDRLSRIEDVLGGRGPDRLIGGQGGNVLAGGPGDDFLSGGARRDKLIGQAGRDRMFGGAGPDILDGLEDERRAAPDRAACGGRFDIVRVSRGDRVGDDCERAQAEGFTPSVFYFAVQVALPLRAQRSGVLEIPLATPAGGLFRGRLAVRYRGLLLGRPSEEVNLSGERRVTARVDLVGPALSRVTSARRLAVEVVVDRTYFVTTLRAPLSPRNGSGGTPA